MIFPVVKQNGSRIGFKTKLRSVRDIRFCQIRGPLSVLPEAYSVVYSVAELISYWLDGHQACQGRHLACQIEEEATRLFGAEIDF